MKMKTTIIECQVGMLIRKDFRKFLDRERFKMEDKLNITWREYKRFFESDFTIKVHGEKLMVDKFCNYIVKLSD